MSFALDDENNNQCLITEKSSSSFFFFFEISLLSVPKKYQDLIEILMFLDESLGALGEN